MGVGKGDGKTKALDIEIWHFPIAFLAKNVGI